MHILLLSQYFPPEPGAPSARCYEHGRCWVRAGHDVTVLTTVPNHPTGVIPPEYRGTVFRREEVDGLRIWRTWIYAAANEGFARRMLSYLSFMLSAVLAASFRRTHADLVMATSPQFFVAVAGYLVSRIKRLPFVLEIRDLWPEAIVAVGAMRRDALAIRLLEKLELFLYRRADLVVTVTESAREDMIARGIPAEKITTIRNGADLSFFSPEPTDRALRQHHGLPEGFLASYIGTHGMAHGLEKVLETAEQLRDRSRIHFLFVGEGAEKRALQELAASKQLANVTFLPAQPKQSMPRFLAASDACLVPLRQRKLFEGTIPSKIFETMASGRPILLGVEGEAARIVREADAGLVVPPEDPKALAEAIRALADDPALCRRLGENGVRYAHSECDRSVLAERLLGHLLAVARQA